MKELWNKLREIVMGTGVPMPVVLGSDVRIFVGDIMTITEDGEFIISPGPRTGH